MNFKTQEKIIAISFTSESSDHYLFLEKVSLSSLEERLKSQFKSELGYLDAENIKCLDCTKKETFKIEETILKILKKANADREELESQDEL